MCWRICLRNTEAARLRVFRRAFAKKSRPFPGAIGFSLGYSSSFRSPLIRLFSALSSTDISVSSICITSFREFCC